MLPVFRFQRRRPNVFASVGAATSAGVSGELTPVTRSGQYRITASYEAKRQNLMVRSVISAGTVQVNGLLGQAMWIRFAKRTALLIKDLTLPFVLAVLGYLFQKRQGARDQRQEVRNIILPFVQALAERHYMPIVRISVLLIRDAARWKSETEAVQREARLKLCFYHFVVILKRMAYLRKDKGQVFFQNRRGEKIVSSIWTIARNQCQNVFGEEGIDKLTTILEDTGSRPPNGTPAQSIDIEYAKFVRELEKSEIKATFQIFSEWIMKEDFAKFLNLVNVFQATLGYESNRPFYEHWYEERIEGLRSEFFPPVSHRFS